jgi:hypothetical protein
LALIDRSVGDLACDLKAAAFRRSRPAFRASELLPGRSGGRFRVPRRRPRASDHRTYVSLQETDLSVQVADQELHSFFLELQVRRQELHSPDLERQEKRSGATGPIPVRPLSAPVRPLLFPRAQFSQPEATGLFPVASLSRPGATLF